MTSTIFHASVGDKGETYSARGHACISEAALPSARELCQLLCDNAPSEYRLYLAKASTRFFDAQRLQAGSDSLRLAVLSGTKTSLRCASAPRGRGCPAAAALYGLCQ
ncbi:hypothetical protein ACKZDW_22540 [Ralstonia syzygii subsp. celebesensis]